MMLAAPGQPLRFELALDERCDVQTLPPGLGARERCAPGAVPCSGWAGLCGRRQGAAYVLVVRRPAGDPAGSGVRGAY